MYDNNELTDQAKYVSFTHNGFHGRTKLKMRVTETDQLGFYIVSDRVARRLNNEVCGIPGCTCGEYVASLLAFCEGYCVEIPGNREIKGYYPVD